MNSISKDHPVEHLSASTVAAAINYPLWRASAVGQSGFRMAGAEIVLARGQFRVAADSALAPYLYAFSPPYRGMVPTVLGMAWARAAIFWGSDYGRDRMRRAGYRDSVSAVVPPLVTSVLVQCVNMPLVRATITIQNPQQSNLKSVSSSLRHIYATHGVKGLWHGTSAGILKTVPKYCTAVVVKDAMEEWILTPADPCSPTYHADRLKRSACKSVAAGLAGAALTNPLDGELI